MRLLLVQYGWSLAEAHPWGTGLGRTYSQQITGEMGVGHVHNGTVTMLIELGFPGFAVVASLLLWIFGSILRSRTIPNQIKGFYFTYFFTIFGRSLSENYTPFDLGNFFNLVFLVFTINFFLYERVGQSSSQPALRPAFHPGMRAGPRMG